MISFTKKLHHDTVFKQMLKPTGYSQMAASVHENAPLLLQRCVFMYRSSCM